MPGDQLVHGHACMMGILIIVIIFTAMKTSSVYCFVHVYIIMQIDPAWKVDELRLAHSKLMPDPHHAALKMMDCLFTIEEMVNEGIPSLPIRTENPQFSHYRCQQNKIYIW